MFLRSFSFLQFYPLCIPSFVTGIFYPSVVCSLPSLYFRSTVIRPLILHRFIHAVPSVVLMCCLLSPRSIHFSGFPNRLAFHLYVSFLVLFLSICFHFFRLAFGSPLLRLIFHMYFRPFRLFLKLSWRCRFDVYLKVATGDGIGSSLRTLCLFSLRLLPLFVPLA